MDTRGMARAMVGDLEGAAGDFRLALPNILEPAEARRRSVWLDRLSRGENPITPEDLRGK